MRNDDGPATRGDAGHGGREGRATGGGRGASDEERYESIAVGYTDRRDLDDFIQGEQGDLAVHGPVHIGRGVEEIETLGPAVTEGTPCLVVPLIRERMDEIQREVSDALDRFQGLGRGAPARGKERPHTIGETGGNARGTSAGAIRTGARPAERP